MTKIIIPWIGYNEIGQRFFRDNLERKLGVIIESRIRTAAQFLKISKDERYKVIITNDEVPMGNQNIIGLMNDDYSGIACYLIKEIRKTPLNGQSYICVVSPYLKSNGLEDQYLKAGANKVLFSSRDQTNELTEIIRTELKRC